MSLNQDFDVKAEDKAKVSSLTPTRTLVRAVHEELLDWMDAGWVDEESKVYQLLTQLAMELGVVGQERIGEEVSGE